MESGQNPILLVVGLIYLCGSGLEFLVRITQGIPHHLPPPFDRNICLAVLVFIVLPAILWPPICIYRIARPLIRAIVFCFREKVDTVTSDDAECTASRDSSETLRDVEKGYELQDATT